MKAFDISALPWNEKLKISEYKQVIIQEKKENADSISVLTICGPVVWRKV